jgi:hypothetical protein
MCMTSLEYYLRIIFRTRNQEIDYSEICIIMRHSGFGVIFTQLFSAVKGKSNRDTF